MKYTEVVFSSKDIQDWQKDLLIEELGGVGFDTFEDTDSGFKAYVATSNFDVQALETLLLQHTNDYSLDYSIQDLEEQNWNALWESNFNPIVVDDLCYVRATFHESKPEFAFEIVIDPKMSFGTGHHQTTSMMLSYVLENDFENKSVLDMGCGTGILGILASKKGAKEVFAVDYDSICVDSVIENSALNNIDNITAKIGSKEAITDYKVDTILANINRNILLDQLDTYSALLSSTGELYLSGFYELEDLDILKEKCQSVGFVYQGHKVKDAWCAAKFIKQ